MSPEIIFVDEETEVGEIAMLLSERKIKRVPVMRNGKLVGIGCRTRISDRQALVAVGEFSIRAGAYILVLSVKLPSDL